MAIVKDLAQVLRVHEHANTSLVLVLLGRRSGQMRVLAKGVRRSPKKGFEGGFDLLTRGEVLVYTRRDGHLWIFKEWEERARLRGLGRSVERLSAGSYLCELAEALTRETAGNAPGAEESHAEALYEVLAEAADALDAGAQAGPVLLAYTFRALQTLGLMPGLERCSRCERTLQDPPRRTARLSHQGLECQDCLADEELEGLPVSAVVPTRRAELARALDERLGGQDRPPDRVRVWLTPETLASLAYVKRTGKSVRLSRAAAASAARALAILVHGALERDLRTLPAAMRCVRAMELARK